MKTTLTALAAAFLLALNVTAIAADSPPDDFSFIEDTEQLMRKLKGQPAPAWLQPAAVDSKTKAELEVITRDSERIQQLTQEALAASTQSKSQLAQVPNKPVLSAQEQAAPRVLVSLGIPENNLKTILEAVYDCNCVAVFQGVPQGWSLPQMIAHVGKLVDANKAPTVTIDPNIFTDLRVASVPVVALPAGGGRYVTMRGLVNIEYMREKAPEPAALAGVDLGSYGPLFTVTEPNFIEEMKRRMMTIDWNKKADEAAGRYWTNRTDWIDLPEVENTTTRLVDPTVVLGQDIKDGDGNMMIRAGRSVNPLKHMPLTKRFVIFDASKAWQVKAALEARDAARAAGRGVQLIMTHFDTSRGWEGFDALTDGLKQHVFVLDKTVKERFQLRAVPSIVEADGFMLKVVEIGRKDWKKN